MHLGIVFLRINVRLKLNLKCIYFSFFRSGPGPVSPACLLQRYSEAWGSAQTPLPRTRTRLRYDEKKE